MSIEKVMSSKYLVMDLNRVTSNNLLVPITHGSQFKKSWFKTGAELAAEVARFDAALEAISKARQALLEAMADPKEEAPLAFGTYDKEGNLGLIMVGKYDHCGLSRYLERKGFGYPIPLYNQGAVDEWTAGHTPTWGFRENRRVNPNRVTDNIRNADSFSTLGSPIPIFPQEQQHWWLNTGGYGEKGADDMVPYPTQADFIKQFYGLEE